MSNEKRLLIEMELNEKIGLFSAWYYSMARINDVRAFPKDRPVDSYSLKKMENIVWRVQSSSLSSPNDFFV